MTDALRFAIPAAIVLAIAGVIFGIAIARLVWAQDLEQAQSIDRIRSRTEAAMRGTIETQEKIIAALKGH